MFVRRNSGRQIWLNDAGRTIEKWWFELNRKFPMVETDEFVIMPNHFHGVVIITYGNAIISNTSFATRNR